MTPDEYLQREKEVQQAVQEYPDLEMGAAFRRWKFARGESPVFLTTSDKQLMKAKEYIKQEAWKPCEKCGGKAIIESVCGGCVEGRKGYKAKFTCEQCLHRELSMTPFLELIQETLKTYGPPAAD